MTQTKKITLTELVQGLEVVLQGDPHCLIEGVCTIQEGKLGHITFLNNPLYKKYLETTNASAVIVTAEEAKLCPPAVNAVIAKDPYYIYSQIAIFFNDKPMGAAGIHPTVVMGEQCEIDKTASIGPHCTIGNHVKIGPRVQIQPGCVIGDFSEIDEGSRLEANVTIYHRILIGKRVLIASGTVIGSDGFGIAKYKGKWHKVPQLGRVILEDDVEIGANCAIDRGAIGDTIIAAGAKLDNLIQIGHNAKVGENTAMAGCVGVAGSATIGKNSLVGGGAGIGGHITIADNTMITGMTAVTKSIREPGIYSSGVGGLTTNLEWRKNSARLHRLDQLTQRIKQLESILSELTGSKV